MQSEPLALLADARDGDRRALARVISLVEDDGPGAADVLAAADRASGRAFVTGITGPPGAGKSTMTDALVDLAIANGAVAVVAVDPTSPFTGGAVLGDRVRMHRHTEARDVYIRSMASRGALGGVAAATPRVITLLDAVGFVEIIIETVGVGQAEVDVVSAADTTVVVVTPGWGDGVQAAKAGLLEVADVLAINKADREGHDATLLDLQQMVSLGARRAWVPPIVSTVATSGSGMDRLWDAVLSHREYLHSAGIERVRSEHRVSVFRRATADEFAARAATVAGTGRYAELTEDVRSRRLDPWAAARLLIDEVASR